jgi:hypothetical protein
MKFFLEGTCRWGEWVLPLPRFDCCAVAFVSHLGNGWEKHWLNMVEKCLSRAFFEKGDHLGWGQDSSIQRGKRRGAKIFFLQMAALIAKECFIPLLQKFLNQICAGFPNETKHCQTTLRDQANQLIRWERRLTEDGKWRTTEDGDDIWYKTFASDDDFVHFMKYMCEQFFPFEEELLDAKINLKFFRHPENKLIQHMDMSKIWKMATPEQRNWIWSQLNMLYLVAVSLRKLPQEVFTHFHRLLDSTTQNLLTGRDHGANIRALREQAMQILKEVGKDKFTALITYFFVLLQSPYSPIPELVSPDYRTYALKFLSLLRSPEGIKLVRRGMNPFLKLAKTEWNVELALPQEKDLQGEDGKTDETKMGTAFQDIVEKVLNTDEKILQNMIENKDAVVDKVKGTWNSMTTRKKPSGGGVQTIDPDSDDEEEDWVVAGTKDEKKHSKPPAVEEEDDGDLADDILVFLSIATEETTSGEMPLGEYQRSLMASSVVS